MELTAASRKIRDVALLQHDILRKPSKEVDDQPLEGVQVALTNQKAD
jgi:hypothetical protein